MPVASGSTQGSPNSRASRPSSSSRAAEVLVRGERFAVVRERESLEDLVRGEHIPRELTEPEAS